MAAVAGAAAAIGWPSFFVSRLLQRQRITSTSFHVISAIQSQPLQIALPAAVLPVIAGLGSLLGNILEGILKAVPKKKTTHSKGRSRRLAGKALRDLTSLNTCSGCGRVKRMHVLCPYCVQNIKDMWMGRLKKVTAEGTKLLKK